MRSRFVACLGLVATLGFAGAGEAFVRVSPRDARYLELADGVLTSPSG